MTPTREEWRPVVGYEGLYEVSDQGRVRSLDRVVVRSNGHPQTCRGRILSAMKDRWGRPVAFIQAGGRRATCRVSVLVLEAFVGPRPAGMVGCHNNGISSDNRPENLRWDTPSANEFDKVRHGTDHNAKKTQCPRRHPLMAPNLVPSLLRSSGSRSCLACQRARNRRYTARRNGSAFDMQAVADFFFAQIMKEAS